MPPTRRGLLRDRSSSALKSIVQSSIKEHSATSLFAQAALTSFSKKSLASTLLSRDFGKQRKASIVSIFGVSSNHALDHSWGCLIYSSCLPVQGLQVRGATRLHTTDFGLGDARTSSGGYKIWEGATRFGGLQDYALRIVSPGTDELILESYKGPFNVTVV